MMTNLPFALATRASFDALVSEFTSTNLSLDEIELLRTTHWRMGEDARLRDDIRFRETPWGRWMLAGDFLANEALYRKFHAEQRGSAALQAVLNEFSTTFGRRCVLCIGDPRFVLRDGDVQLAASEMSRQPAIEKSVGDLEKYTTHLPLHTLKAAAASEPAGEWGPGAQEQAIETLGWLRVSLPGRRLNDRMFVAKIEGRSMDDGRSGLVDGGYAVFELWPSGSRQLLNVLVRGAFNDPETGTYALKKYVADQRTEEGVHQHISLVSLNPDKERYPDIELAVTQEDALTIVAKVVQPLKPEDYARRPKPKRRPGRRLLDGNAGIHEQGENLGQRIAAFFEGRTATEGDEDEDSPATNDGWQTQLVCLSADAGGPHLEAGPLEGLPPFVKKLRVVGNAGWDGYLLAANLRKRPDRLPVRPGTGPWSWQAVGFEDEEDLGLARLACEAIPAACATVFRVDTDGIGQRQIGTVLALGQVYRLLLPPGVSDGAHGNPLSDGWLLWTLDLRVAPTESTRAALAALGLGVSEDWPGLVWALVPPAAWQMTVRGQSYPVFEVGSSVFVHVSGLSVHDADSAMLFLRGPDGTERLALPHAESATVSLGVLAPGQWACALVHPRTAVRTTTLLFEVAANAARHVSAAWSVEAGTDITALAITAPPGWPVSLRWRVLSDLSRATEYAGEDGQLDLSGVLPRFSDLARRSRIADLVIDFGELGQRVIHYDHRPSVSAVREALVGLWSQRQGLVRSQTGAWLTLKPSWFEPVTRLFGYIMETLDISALPDTPHNLAAWRLLIDERDDGRIVRTPSRVLVLTTDLDMTLSECLEWVDSTCDLADVRDALITDGIRWTMHRRRHSLRRKIWDFAEVIEANAVDAMLAELAEGL